MLHSFSENENSTKEEFGMTLFRKTFAIENVVIKDSRIDF